MGKKKGHNRYYQHDLEFAPPPCPPPQDTWFAWLMPCFALANTAIFIYSMYVNNCPSSPSSSSSQMLMHNNHLLKYDSCVFPSLGRYAFEPLSINPLFGPSTDTLDKLGALDYDKIVEDGQVWRLVSCIWLHGGVIHLIANMMSLLFIGVRLEQEFGFGKIGVLYLLSGLGGSLVSCFSTRTSISVGASGALFGLLGAMLSELVTNWTLYADKCAALLTLMVVIIINLAVGLVPHVDSAAHIGGFASGFLLGFVLLMRPQSGWVNHKHNPPGFNIENAKPKYKLYQYFFWIVAFVLLILGFMHGFLKLFAAFMKLH